MTTAEQSRRAAALVGGTWTSPASRHIRCQFCGWESRQPRNNGAWMRLKKSLRLHIEEKHADKLEGGAT